MVLGRSAGGIGGHVDQLATQLRAAGHDVGIVTDAGTARRFGWADAHLLWPFHGLRTMHPGLLHWHRIMRLAGTVDVVHAHGHQAAVVAALAARRAKPRPAFVVSLHNSLPGEADARAAAPASSPDTRSSPRPRGAGARLRRLARSGAAGAVSAALRTADLVTGASEDLVELARRLGAQQAELAPVASPRVGELLAKSVAAQPDRPSRRASLLGSAGIVDTGPLVLTVARIAPQKDLPTLARAARAASRPGTWVVVGGGDEAIRASLGKELSGIPLGFAGERLDVEEWLAAAEVFVLTSVWEARALVVQEAMAAGVPVVVTATGGLPGLVGDAGVLVPVGDAEAVARAVDRLLGDPAERERLARAGREVAATWDAPADEARRWIARYSSALRG